MKFDRKDLDALGKKWLKYLKEEIAKDAAKSTFIPRDPEFLKSFSYSVEPGGIVSLYSTWPWLEVITKGTRGKYKMAWLTQQAGVNVVPLAQKDGSVHFRTAPLTFGEAWVHPKIAKHTFITRAYERAFQDHVDQVIGTALRRSMDGKKKR
jgi:hypothetical protein